MSTEMENILAELLVGELTESEKQALIEKVKADANAWEEYQMILKTDQLIQDELATSPSMRFVKEVMIGYDRLVTRKQNSRMLFAFTAFAATLVMFVAMLPLLLENASTSPLALPIAPQVDFTGILSILTADKTFLYGFGIFNIVLMMVLFDKYWRRRVNEAG